MKRVFFNAALLAGLCGMVLSSTLAQAQTTPKLLGTHHAWEAYTYKEGNDTVCFMLSRPSKTAAYRGGKLVKNVNRDEVYILVTHRPAQNSRNVVSINVGYPFKLGSNVSVQIDKNKSYQMFTADDKALKEGAANNTAWARDDTDQTLVKAMAAGNTMRVIGTSRRDTETRDTYSLAGFTAAHAAIDQACK